MLVNLIEGKPLPQKTLVFEPVLQVRGSCGALKEVHR
jgi:DNA-binding LacI/PurR family transcriptional regulator